MDAWHALLLRCLSSSGDRTMGATANRKAVDSTQRDTAGNRSAYQVGSMGAGAKGAPATRVEIEGLLTIGAYLEFGAGYEVLLERKHGWTARCATAGQRRDRLGDREIIRV
jgi:hypothetical protein